MRGCSGDDSAGVSGVHAGDEGVAAHPGHAPLRHHVPRQPEAQTEGGGGEAVPVCYVVLLVNPSERSLVWGREDGGSR